MVQSAHLCIPKVIWTLWLQGWGGAPHVAKASLASWSHRNPAWTINALDLQNLSQFIPDADLRRILDMPKQPEATSDQIRFELLYRYGGVWADATTICAKPLDEWLPSVMQNGFFAFAKPGPDRMISTWFLAAEKGSYIAERWRAASIQYWMGRETRDTYFWPHNLFAEVYRDDQVFREIWDSTPVISAQHIMHFGPNNAALCNPPSPSYLRALEYPPAPVYKLTHKLDRLPGPDSLIEAICAFGESYVDNRRPDAGEPKTILVGWYGSFDGHGTIGDLLSLVSVVSYLVGCGYNVLHATAMPFDITGAKRVDWREIDPLSLDRAIFVCGPVLKNHTQTQAFFAHYRQARLGGAGVSLLSEGHPNRHNPFEVVFAREGSSEDFGDVAIVAPKVIVSNETTDAGFTIGISLRGLQSEYGAENCLWLETEETVHAIAESVLAQLPGKVVIIENHLQRSGKSPQEIEELYNSCDLVLTSRFHGAIGALRHGVPFIAIDQIRGGAKVYRLLSRLGWPHVYQIEGLSRSVLCSYARALLLGEGKSNLMAARARAVADANRTLAYLGMWVSEEVVQHTI